MSDQKTKPYWREAIERAVEKEPLNLPDSLPTPYVTLVEAVSWLALGCAFSHKVWKLDALLATTIKRHEAARKKARSDLMLTALRLLHKDRKKTKRGYRSHKTENAVKASLEAARAIRAAFKRQYPTGKTSIESEIRRAQEKLFKHLAVGVFKCKARRPDSLKWTRLGERIVTDMPACEDVISPSRPATGVALVPALPGD
jgi:hypothetical protein